MVTVAVSVPVPARPAAVNVVVGPVAGFSRPRLAGSSDHAATTGTVLPNESVPSTAKVCGELAPTVADVGFTATETTGPGRIVSVCVPLVMPAAAAVRSDWPALVSW